MGPVATAACPASRALLSLCSTAVQARALRSQKAVSYATGRQPVNGQRALPSRPDVLNSIHVDFFLLLKYAVF